MSLSTTNKLAFLLSLQRVTNVPQNGESKQNEDKHILDDSRQTNVVPDVDVEPFRITPSDCSKDDDDAFVITYNNTVATKQNALGLIPKPSQPTKRCPNNSIYKPGTERVKNIEKALIVSQKTKIMPIYSKARQKPQQIQSKIRKRKDKTSKTTSYTKSLPNTLVSNEQREQIVAKYESGCTVNEIIETLNLPKPLVDRVVCRYKKTGEVTLDENVSFKQANLPLDIGLSIRLWMNDDCNVSLAQLVEKVWTTYGKRVNTNSIVLALTGFYYFFNRVQISPKNKNKSTLGQVKQYATEFSTTPQRVSVLGIVFLDYGVLNVTFHAQTKPHIKQKSIYTLCAMNESGLLHYLASSSHIGKNGVREFVNVVKDKLRERKIEESVMVIGSDTHQRYSRLDDVVGYYKCTAMFLPANASFLNPVDCLFKNFKGIIRRANPQNEDELLSAIACVPSLITATECKNYFELMWSYVPRCMEEEEISDFMLLG